MTRLSLAGGPVEWLSGRAAGADEGAVISGLHDAAYQLTRTRLPRLLAFYVAFPDSLVGERKLRARRSNAGRLGSYEADSAAVLGRWMFWWPLRTRVAASLATAVIAVLLHGELLPSILLGVAVGSLRASTRSRAERSFFWAPWLLGIPAVAIAILIDVGQWWVCVLALLSGWTLQSAIRAYFLLTFAPRSSPYRFVPMLTRLALLRRGLWSTFVVGIDKAVHDDPIRATRFLSRINAEWSPALGPILDVARAAISARVTNVDEALRHLQSAAGGIARLPPPARGWVLLQTAEILLLCGRVEESRVSIGQSLALLRPGADNSWYDRALGHQIGLLLHEPDVVESVLESIHALRLRGLKRSDIGLIARTEIWLLSLMLDLGNQVGTLRVSRGLVDSLGAQKVLGSTAGQLVEQDLVLAQLLMTVWTDPEALAIEAHDRAESASTADNLSQFAFQSGNFGLMPTDGGARGKTNLELAVGMGFTALQALRVTRHPIAEAVAHLTVARGLVRLDATSEDALAHALSAIRTIQDVRYHLPTSSWRASWEALQSVAFDVAFDLAFARREDLLVVELIEGHKSHVLPRTSDEASRSATAVLEALLVSPLAVASRDATPTAATESPLVDYVPALTVSGGCWTASPGATPIALESVLDRVEPEPHHYWTGTISNGWYVWAVRESWTDEWSVGRQSLDGAGTALDDLLDGFSDAIPGLGAPGHVKRISPSPLLARTRAVGGPASRAESEIGVLGAAADLLLPPSLRAVLLAASREAPLRLLIGLGGQLGSIPTVGWPLDSADPDSPRLIDRATSTIVPSIALISHTNAARASSPGAEWSICPAILAPHHEEDTPESERLVRAAVVPPGALDTVAGPASKDDVRRSLERAPSIAGNARLLYIAGHVDTGAAPGDSGLRLARGERLTTADLLATRDGAPLFPIPGRVILSGCTSLGYERTSQEASVRYSAEWLGLGAGVLLAGADDVVCALYRLPETNVTERMDLALVERLTTPDAPASSLRDVQLRELDAWRAGGMTIPLVWQAYVHVSAAGADHPDGGSPGEL